MTKPRIIFNIAGLVLLIAFFYYCARYSEGLDECTEAKHQLQNSLDEANTKIAIKEFAIEEKNYDQQIEGYTALINIKPDNYYALRERGIAYYKKGNYDEAIEDFSAAFKIEPRRIGILLFRGGTYFKKGNYDEAIEDYTAILKIIPNDYSALYYRGRTYYKKGDYDKAIEDLEAALKNDPNNTDAKQLLEEVRQAKAGVKE